MLLDVRRFVFTDILQSWRSLQFVDEAGDETVYCLENVAALWHRHNEVK